MKKKIVLFNPRYKASDIALPVSLLAVSAPLLEDGYEVVLLDANLAPDWERFPGHQGWREIPAACLFC